MYVCSILLWLKYYSAMKMNKILIHATTWEKSDYIMQNEKGQILRYFYPKGQILFFFPLCEFPGIGKFTETEGKMMVTKIWAGRLGSCSSLGTEFLFGLIKKKSWKIVVMFAQYCEGP